MSLFLEDADGDGVTMPRFSSRYVDRVGHMRNLDEVAFFCLITL